MIEKEIQEMQRELRYIETVAESINGRMYSMRTELSEIAGLALRLQKKINGEGLGKAKPNERP